MRANVIGTGSSGNCYLLSTASGETLILDCGMSVDKVKRALNFDLSKISGVFVTHVHNDHAKYRNEFERMGVDVFAPYDKDKIRENRMIGKFSVQAFRLPHGETYSYGALIRHTDTKETVLYATDFEYIPYTFRACRINHYLVECNYQPNLIDLDAPNKEHKVRGHCSLETCKTFLNTNYTYDMQNVLLIHGGLASTDPQECVEEVERVLNPNVVVRWAKNGTEYELEDKRLPFSED